MTYPLVVLLLDAGLRIGEARGLRWDSVAWNPHTDDSASPNRHLAIEESIPSGLRDDPEEIHPPKWGKGRKVQLSLRLRAALDDWKRIQTPQDSHERVFPGLDGANFAKRGFRRSYTKAGLASLRPKDLRDTYASWLLTCGVPLAFVSKQLGHAGPQVTERHYARWAGDGSEFRQAEIRPGEVPADLLSRLPRNGTEKHERAEGQSIGHDLSRDKAKKEQDRSLN